MHTYTLSSTYKLLLLPSLSRTNGVTKLLDRSSQSETDAYCCICPLNLCFKAGKFKPEIHLSDCNVLHFLPKHQSWLKYTEKDWHTLMSLYVITTETDSFWLLMDMMMRLKGTEGVFGVCLCNPLCLIRLFILFIFECHWQIISIYKQLVQWEMIRWATMKWFEWSINYSS